jgi:MFS family permease
MAYYSKYAYVFFTTMVIRSTLKGSPVKRNQVKFLYLNLGHFLDHLFMLIFASVAAFRLTSEWGISYASLIPYATPGFVAFGVGAILAGWIADKWSREGMIVIFFIGIGASSILVGMANNPFQIAASLTLVGIFAAIYHPVGLAMVVDGRDRTGIPLAINGIFGNLGVACAALLTGFLIDYAGWRSAFYVPGIISILLGLSYLIFINHETQNGTTRAESTDRSHEPEYLPISRKTLLRVFGVIFFTTAVGGLIFQSTTFALPRIFEERLVDIAGSATLVGWYAFLVFSVAAFAQLVIGYLVDHHPIRIVFAVVALFQAIFFFLMTQLNGIAALLVAIAFMLVVFGQIPINDVLVGRMVRGEWRSRAYAIRYVVSFSVMASAVPMIAWVHGNWGFGRLFEILAIAAMAIFAATFLLPDSSISLQSKTSTIA